MTTMESNVHRLDAAYVPFPPFSEWAAKTVVDTVRWDRYNASVNERGKSSAETLARARQVATRAAALDTGAIEGLYEVDRGFTYTVALETAAWELALDRKGEQVRPLFEAQLHAYDFVLDLATKAEPFSEAAVRQLHVEICRAQLTYRVMTAVGPQEQALPKGRYKVLPNHVLTRDGVHHSYAPVDVTPEEMARLMNELRSDAFLVAHPVMQAAYAHYGLVVIHPFSDGNGRVARALASAFTYRAISMPIVILAEQKEDYLDALAGADKCDLQAFVNFMLERALDTVMLVDESLHSATTQNLAESVAELRKLYTPQTEFTEAQVDNAGLELSRLVVAAMNSVIAGIHRQGSPPLPVIGSASETIDPGHSYILGDPAFRRPLRGGSLIRISLSSGGFAAAQANRAYGLWCPGNPDGFYDLRLVNTAGEDAFVARTHELIPETSGALKIRIRIFAERVIGELMAELKERAEKKFWG